MYAQQRVFISFVCRYALGFGSVIVLELFEHFTFSVADLSFDRMGSKMRLLNENRGIVVSVFILNDIQLGI